MNDIGVHSRYAIARQTVTVGYQSQEVANKVVTGPLLQT